MTKYLYSGLLFASLLGVGRPSLADTPANVPAEFQDLYPVLQQDLDRFQGLVDNVWNKTKPGGFAGNFAGELASANCALGPTLLKSGYLTNDVQPELLALKNLGINTVTLAIHFPILYNGYFQYYAVADSTGPAMGSAAQYQAFYQSVISLAHSNGMKVFVDNQTIFSQAGASSGLVDTYGYFQSSLTYTSYEIGRSSQALTIASQLQPDAVSILNEPSTEAQQSGYTEFNGPTQVAAFVSSITVQMETLQTSHPFGLHSTILLGAGLGNWELPKYQVTLSSYAVNGSLDFINVHIFYLNTVPLDYATNAMTIVNTALAAHKKLAGSQEWGWKLRNNESLSADDTFARDAYSFWEPLDEEYLQILTKLSYYGNFWYISAYWDRNLFTYLDYNSVPGCPAPADQSCTGTQIENLESQAAAANYAGPTYSPTGLAYQKLIAGDLFPEISNYAAASPATVAGTTTTLNVSATDGFGGTGVSYAWAVTGTPPGTPVIASPSAASTPVTFSSSGTYNFTVTVTANTGGLSVQTSTQVIVGAASPTGPIIPVLNFPAFVPLNGQLSFIDSVDTSFLWTFTLQLNPSSPLTTTTSVPSLNVGTLPLSPSAYVVQVTAINAQGTASAPSHAIVTFAPSGLNQIRVYPNPWRSDQDSSLPITFDHLTLGSTVKIFDIAGHWVKTLTPANDSVTWDRTNDNGNSVASGLYFYLITDGQGNKVRGKLTIIK